MSSLRGVEDLEVYQRSFDLHLQLHYLSLNLPAFENLELGGDLRKSSGSIPSMIAKGWGSISRRVYVESLDESLGFIRQVEHYLKLAVKKRYIKKNRFDDLIQAYGEVKGQLKGMLRSMNRSVA